MAVRMTPRRPAEWDHLRDYFAAYAINAMVHVEWGTGGWNPETIAQHAYEIADAMIAARAKQPDEEPLPMAGNEP